MNKHLDFNDYKKRVLKNPAIKAQYNQLQPEFELINTLIEARKTKKLTQAQLASKMGTTQSVISRLEIGRGNPTLEFLKKIARSLDSHLEIRFAA